MKWRILWGENLEHQLNDLDQYPLDKADECAAAEINFILLCRREGSSWKVQDDGGSGVEIYWDSIMKAVEEKL